MWYFWLWTDKLLVIVKLWAPSEIDSDLGCVCHVLSVPRWLEGWTHCQVCISLCLCLVRQNWDTQLYNQHVGWSFSMSSYLPSVFTQAQTCWTSWTHHHPLVFPGSFGHFLARTEVDTQLSACTCTGFMCTQKLPAYVIQALLMLPHSFACWSEISRLLAGDCQRSQRRFSWFSWEKLSALSAWHHHREHAIVDTPKLPTNHSCFLPTNLLRIADCHKPGWSTIRV